MFSRLIRIVAGLAVLSIGVLLIAPYALHSISRQAIVTAPVLDVASPIAGTLQLHVPRFEEPEGSDGTALELAGGAVARGQLLATTTDERHDRTRLLEVRTELLRLDAEIPALQNDVIALRAQIDLHRSQYDAYVRARRAQLDAEAEEARALVEEARIRSVDRAAEARRLTTLAARQIASEANVERSQAEARAAEAALQAARQRLEAIRVARTAADEGTFIGDSYNDQPYSAQRLDQLRVQVAELDNLIRLRQVERTSLAAMREELEKQSSSRAAAELRAPVSGRVWNIDLGSGTHVREGQRVMRILDCGRTIVAANVSEGDYNALQIGDAATFRAHGAAERMPAVIAGLAGAGSYRDDFNLAIPPRATEANDFIVYVAVPELAAECPIGRTGRVTFAQDNTIERRLASLVRGLRDRLP